MTVRVLVVDEDRVFSETVANHLGMDRLLIDSASTLKEARSKLQNRYDILIVDRHLPDGDGMVLADEARDVVEGARMLLAAERTALGNAAEALAAGIDDYIAKPVEMESLRLAVLRSVQAVRDERIAAVEHYRRRKLAEELPKPVTSTTSSAITNLLTRANRTTSPVLFQGETGTGKTRLAQTLHTNGPRSAGPFLAVNCGAIPEALIESELFGHERGAFTGAIAPRLGVFELAASGTLFLDEIAELSLSAQARLLTAIEERSIRRVGSSTERHVDVRIVAATNVDLRAAVTAGRFREDLRYRLEVFVIHVPPLRERPEELKSLTDYWLRVLGAPTGHRLAAGELERLAEYPWPGNIRELRNVLERTLLLQDDSELRPSAFLERPSAPTPSSNYLPNLKLDELERRRILEAVEMHKASKADAAQALGISLATLRRKLRELGV